MFARADRAVGPDVSAANVTMATPSNQAQLTFGWREWVSLPDLGVTAIKAKIDTGARTSALHASDLQVEGEWVIFRLHPQHRDSGKSVACRAMIADRRIVTDSGGHKEERIVIRTRLGVGATIWPVEVTLTDRDDMRFRMLIGRTAMKGIAMVDPGRSYLASRRPKRPAR